MKMEIRIITSSIDENEKLMYQLMEKKSETKFLMPPTCNDKDTRAMFFYKQLAFKGTPVNKDLKKQIKENENFRESLIKKEGIKTLVIADEKLFSSNEIRKLCRLNVNIIIFNSKFNEDENEETFLY